MRTAAPILALAAFVGASSCGPKKAESFGVPPPPAVGRTAPPLELDLVELDGTPRRLTELRAGARATVLNVFTTGSDESLLLTGVLNGQLATWIPYGVLFLGVSLDRNPDLVEPFVAGAGIGFPVVIAGEALWDGHSPLGRVWAVPFTAVLDREGRLRFYYYGLLPATELESWLDQLLAESPLR